MRQTCSGKLVGIIQANFSPSSTVNLSPDAILWLIKLSKSKRRFSTVIEQPFLRFIQRWLIPSCYRSCGDNGAERWNAWEAVGRCVSDACNRFTFSPAVSHRRTDRRTDIYSSAESGCQDGTRTVHAAKTLTTPWEMTAAAAITPRPEKRRTSL